ncbi:hypothetical protein FOL47_003367, partial [Perkinsus chesapeaki]
MYLTRGTVAKWKYAWPSVMWAVAFFRVDEDSTYCTPEKRWKLIPNTLRESWKGRAQQYSAYSGIDLQQISVCFVDKTTEKKWLNDMKNTGDLQSIRSYLEASYIPCVRCPCGAQEFTDDCKSMRFYHIIEKALPTFTSFGSDAYKTLRGMRNDFAEPWIQYGQHVSGAVRIDGEGLSLLTCDEHPRGILLQYVHAPSSPIGLLPAAYAEQLGPVVMAPALLRNLQPKYSSHTWQLNEVRGGYQGLSSWVVSQRRKWAIRSELLARQEALVYKEREDLRSYIEHHVRTEYNEVVFRQLEQESVPDKNILHEAVKGASYITAQESVEMLRTRKTKPDDSRTRMAAIT